MTNEEFQIIVEQQLQTIKEILIAKADEYARGDRLSNFKRIAVFRNVPPEDALFALVSKHIVALNDFIKDLDTDIVQPIERWDEKINDIINYMILLKALIRERVGK